jgi:hypothetical protein
MPVIVAFSAIGIDTHSGFTKDNPLVYILNDWDIVSVVELEHS